MGEYIGTSTFDRILGFYLGRRLVLFSNQKVKKPAKNIQKKNTEKKTQFLQKWSNQRANRY